jgi:hypothetical protein
MDEVVRREPSREPRQPSYPRVRVSRVNHRFRAFRCRTRDDVGSMRTSLSSFRVAPRLRRRMAKVWRRTIGETHLFAALPDGIRERFGGHDGTCCLSLLALRSLPHVPDQDAPAGTLDPRGTPRASQDVRRCWEASGCRRRNAGNAFDAWPVSSLRSLPRPSRRPLSPRRR